MLLRYFRKIDAYSGIRLLALGVVSGAAVCWISSDSPTDLGLFIASYLVFGTLSWYFFRERWAFKGTTFRFLLYALLALLWSIEFISYSLILASFLLEANWQFIENFRLRKNVFWLLNSASLSALYWIFFPDGGWFVAFGTFVTLVLVGQLNAKNYLQWISGFALISVVPIAIGWVKGYDLIYGPSVPVNTPLEWFVVPSLLFLLTINQFFISYRKANNLNKSRSLLALFWMVFGSGLVVVEHGMGGIVLIITGLSYQGANALYYIKRRIAANIVFLILLVYSLVYAFNLLELI